MGAKLRVASQRRYWAPGCCVECLPLPSGPSSLLAISRWGSGWCQKEGNKTAWLDLPGVSILFGELISLVENKYFLKTGISSTSLLFFFFFLLDSSKVGKIPKT